VADGERLTSDESRFLFTEADPFWLGKLAHRVRLARSGRRTYFVRNRHITPTNICVHRCAFCSFSADSVDERAFFFSLDEILSTVTADATNGIDEFHIVGGMPPPQIADYGYFRGLLAALHAQFPRVHLAAFTAVEIDWFAQLTGWSYRKVLADLKDAGLGSLTGGGAEIFDWEVRRRLCPKKVRAEGWLAVHREAHALGIPTNATMLYGHLERPEHKVSHLLALYDLQAETGGFRAFIPLAYHPQGNRLGRQLGRSFRTTALQDLRHLAASRIILHNFPHVKAYWVEFGLKLAQVMLSWGADDIEGTVGEEHIYHDAGAGSPQGVAVDELAYLIEQAGFVPVLRDGAYNELLLPGAVTAGGKKD